MLRTYLLIDPREQRLALLKIQNKEIWPEINQTLVKVSKIETIVNLSRGPISREPNPNLCTLEGLIYAWASISEGKTNALSFYVTKTVLVGPKWFWSDQIDLDLTIMIWSRPKWNGHNQNELVMTISFWLWPNHYGQVEINLVRPKSFWTDQNCYGHI